MGGELEAGLFIGPIESKKIVDWILLLCINSKGNIIEQMEKEYNESYDSDDETKSEFEFYCMNDLYLSSVQINQDYDKLLNKLEELDLQIISMHNCEHHEFKIGRLIETLDTNIHIDIVNSNKKIWDEFGVKNIHIFGGMLGDVEVSFD